MARSLRIVIALAAISAASLIASPAGAAPIDNSSARSWVRIVDVSSYQPNIDWAQLSRAGVAGIYIKATEGTWYVNPYAAAQRAGAASIGMPYGGYDFARPDASNAVADAQYFVASGGAQGTLPPVLDLETEAPGAVQWAITWLTTVKQLTGRTPTIYTGQYSWFWNPALSAWPLWLAAYPLGYQHVTDDSPANVAWANESSGAWSGWSMWQFTSVGQIYGIPGNVDVSAVTPQWWAAATGAGVAPPGTPITPTQGTRYAAGVYGPGSSGDKVVYIQKLVGVPADGIYGAQTQAAVAAYQCRFPAGTLSCDGIWGPATQNATNDLMTWLAAVAANPVASCSNTYLTYGSSGHCVAVFQQALDNRGYHLSVDGAFGQQTYNAARWFQATHGLGVDGVVGPHTWGAVA